MHYLIDGYNFFFRAQTDILPLQQKRGDFIAALDHLFATLNLSCTIVFDSNQDLTTPFPSKKQLSHIDVVFSPNNLSADDYIIEWLTAQSHLKQITVVTSDKPLAKQARHLGAPTLSLTHFFALIAKKERHLSRDRQEEKIAVESEAELQRLLKIFESRLDP